MEPLDPTNLSEGIIARILIVVAVVIGATLLSRALQLPIRRMLKNSKFNTDGKIFYTIIRVFVWGSAICFILDAIFDIDMPAILGALGIVGIAISLGAQQTIANVIGGLIISLSDLIGIDDWITIKGHKEGRIVGTNWRRTLLEDEDEVVYAVPNSVMVSEVVAKGNPYYPIIVPFALKTDTPDVEGLLVECEQVVLDRQIETGHDWEEKRPKAHIVGTQAGSIQAEIKLYVCRDYDTRYVKRAVLPALIDLLQQRDALAELTLPSSVEAE